MLAGWLRAQRAGPCDGRSHGKQVSSRIRMGLAAAFLFSVLLLARSSRKTLLRCARSSMDRVLPSEGRGCWFDPSRARQEIADLHIS